MRADEELLHLEDTGIKNKSSSMSKTNMGLEQTRRAERISPLLFGHFWAAMKLR